MSEPIIEIDYVFHFASGEPLFVTITEGRDTASFHQDGYEIIVHHELGDDTLTIFPDRLNGMRKTRREVEPEPHLPGGDAHGT